MQTMKQSIIHNLDPARFAEQVLGFKADPWQADVLRYEGARLMMLCSRQSGKTTAAAIKALHTALFYPDSLTLIVSPSQRQSSEMFRLVTKQMEKLNDPPLKVEDNKLSCTLASGSRIVSLPSDPNTVRGYSGPRLVLIDEAARCTESLYLAIRPSLATSGGQLILLSTPNGRQGFFFQAWESEAESWEKIKITADQVSRISPEFLQEERETLGERFYSQEYNCEFVEGESAVFRYTDIMRCFKSDIKPLNLWEDDR